jgi:hypothetical protein
MHAIGILSILCGKDVASIIKEYLLPMPKRINLEELAHTVDTMGYIERGEDTQLYLYEREIALSQRKKIKFAALTFPRAIYFTSVLMLSRQSNISADIQLLIDRHQKTISFLSGMHIDLEDSFFANLLEKDPQILLAYPKIYRFDPFSIV